MLHDMGTAQALLPVVTNLAIVPAAAWAARHYLVLECAVMLSVLVASTAYHVCDGFGLCVLPFRTLLLADHFFATYVFMALAVYAMDIRRWRVALALQLALGYVVLLTLLLEGHSVGVLAALVTLAGVAALTAWALRGGPPRYDWLDLGAATALAVTGFVLFAFLGADPRLYWLTHSLWHVAIMAAAYFLLEIKNRRRSLLLLTRPCEPEYTGLPGAPFGVAARIGAAAPLPTTGAMPYPVPSTVSVPKTGVHPALSQHCATFSGGIRGGSGNGQARMPRGMLLTQPAPALDQEDLDLMA